ncbi:biotin/lipoyl-binding protein [Patulibacter sp. NPDC049589]|uniref:biotin/lipoyl-binding protein n=1 Tax=Patulibacter sp. NPDC049589 TaxID=3154731 RepID=UPI0034148474
MGAIATATVIVAVVTVGPEAAAQSEGRVVTAKAGVVQQTVSGTGNLAPANQVDLDFATSGTVKRVFVKEGQHLEAGQLIARLDDARQKVAVAQAEAALDAARTALDDAEDADTTASVTGGTTTTVSAQLHGATADLSGDASLQPAPASGVGGPVLSAAAYRVGGRRERVLVVVEKECSSWSDLSQSFGEAQHGPAGHSLAIARRSSSPDSRCGPRAQPTAPRSVGPLQIRIDAPGCRHSRGSELGRSPEAAPADWARVVHRTAHMRRDHYPHPVRYAC